MGIENFAHTNAHKYKTADEREKAFNKFCRGKICPECLCGAKRAHCSFLWLELEAEIDMPDWAKPGNFVCFPNDLPKPANHPIKRTYVWIVQEPERGKWKASRPGAEKLCPEVPKDALPVTFRPFERHEAVEASDALCGLTIAKRIGLAKRTISEVKLDVMPGLIISNLLDGVQFNETSEATFNNYTALDGLPLGKPIVGTR